MATPWVPGPLHSKGTLRVFLHQELFFARVVHSVGVTNNGNHTAQAQESPLDSGATNKPFFISER